MAILEQQGGQGLLIVNRFADIFDELKPTRSLLRKFGEIKAELQKTGELLPDTDLLIAATALDAGAVLVTGNTKHFTRIPGLPLGSLSERSAAESLVRKYHGIPGAYTDAETLRKQINRTKNRTSDSDMS